MLGFLENKWVLGSRVGLLMLGFSYWKGYTAGKEHIQQKWDAAEVQWQSKVQAEADKARLVERQMQTKADKIQKEKVDAVKTVNAKYAALANSLRNRPEARNTQMPESSSSSVGCTGEGLARPDAEFLAGYAADAARLQAAYDSCKAAYEVIQNAAE